MTTADYVAIDWASWMPVADEASSEPELCGALYWLVRLLQPELVVETGTYKGHATVVLARAVRDNGHGRVISCEPNPQHYTQALDNALTALGTAVVRLAQSADVPELSDADFLFLDSDYKYRADEIARAKRGATIVIHDAYKSYDPNIETLAPLIESLGGLCFRCGIDGRGFGILVKK